ncbi:hypothetical protein TYRP_004128 [Tyrophagus putrescentiae]|nr:hypothetical protein TYRP_004128 [Tyrophagus putrescentiae]
MALIHDSLKRIAAEQYRLKKKKKKKKKDKRAELQKRTSVALSVAKNRCSRAKRILAGDKQASKYDSVFPTQQEQEEEQEQKEQEQQKEAQRILKAILHRQTQ